MARNKTAPKSLIQLVFDEDGLEFRIKDTPKGYNLYSLSKSPQQIYYLVVIKAAYEDYIIEKKEDCRLFIGPNEDLEEIAIVEY